MMPKRKCTSCIGMACAVLIIQSLFASEVAGDSLEGAIGESQFEGVLGIEAHAVKFSKLLGMRRIGVANYYYDIGPVYELNTENLQTLFNSTRQGNSISLKIAGESAAFQQQDVDELLNRFLSTVSQLFTNYGFELSLIAVPTPNSIEYTEFRYFKNIAPLKFLFPVHPGESFKTFAMKKLPLLAHEMFHVSQRIEKRKDRLVKPESFESEVAASLFGQCIYLWVFNEPPNLNTNLFPQEFIALSSTESDDKIKRQYISEYLGEGHVELSHAGQAMLYYYLVSGRKAQSEDRLTKIENICTEFFIEKKIEPLLGEIGLD